MFEKIVLASVLMLFILAFAVRNIKTYLKTGQSIKGKSTKLTVSILLSTLIYSLIFLRIVVLDAHQIFEYDALHFENGVYIGYTFIGFGFVIGCLSLLTMRNSWRVGIKYDQKTDLVTNGIYKFSRNPYFFSYDLLILGYILIFPSIIIIVLYLILITVFHFMILEEERYLQSIHGGNYESYKSKVGRYFII